MTPEEIAAIDRALMQVFEKEDSCFGLPIEAVENHLLRFNVRGMNRGFLLGRIEKLEQVHRFLASVSQTMNRAVRYWRITPEGVQWLEDQGL